MTMWMEINGRSTVIATTIDFDVKTVSQFATLGDLLAAFDPELSGRAEAKVEADR